VRRGTRAAALGLQLAAAAGLVAPAASAQNAEGFFYSEDAALLAGAVTARPGDSGSLWYDPAGLAAIDRGRVSANGSVFGLRLRHIPAALETRLGGASIELDGSSADIIAVPNALAFAFQVTDGVTVGAGLFVTERDVRKSADDAIEVPLPDVDGATLSERIDVQSDVTKYHLGPGVGFRLAPGLRLGVAAFLTYRTESSIAQLALGYASPAGNAHEIIQGTVNTTIIGVTGSVGIQADLGKHVHVGLVARPPELFLHGSSDGGAVGAQSQTLEDPPLSELQVAQAVDPESGSSLVAPPRFTAGVLVSPYRELEIGADVDLTTGMDNPALDISRSLVVNGRAGIRGMVSPRLVLGGGVFTDFSPESSLGGFLGAEVIDWFGGIFGVTLRTPLALADRPDEPEALVLSTTLAARYAIGVGEARAIAIGDVEAQLVRDVVFHDIMPFFGSSILF
jgi:hypothetical protein